ncbi:hypothetical protein B0O99DRAFT_599315 [Bisporella sp. PMI_857]|nr:hypothetical protein B0O99DRAFT_599315 [Bisporella sp. PMI_857]
MIFRTPSAAFAPISFVALSRLGLQGLSKLLLPRRALAWRSYSFQISNVSVNEAFKHPNSKHVGHTEEKDVLETLKINLKELGSGPEEGELKRDEVSLKYQESVGFSLHERSTSFLASINIIVRIDSTSASLIDGLEPKETPNAPWDAEPGPSMYFSDQPSEFSKTIIQHPSLSLGWAVPHHAQVTVHAHHNRI